MGAASGRAVPAPPAGLGRIDRQGQAEQGHDQGAHPPSHASPHREEEIQHAAIRAGSRRGSQPGRYANGGLEAGQTSAGTFPGSAIWPVSAVKSGRPRQIALPRPSGVSNLLSACERGRYMRNWCGSGPAPAARMLRASAFQGSGPTRWVWHLRRDAETGRMSVLMDSSGRGIVLQTNSCTVIQPLPPARRDAPTIPHEHPMLLPQLWHR